MATLSLPTLFLLSFCIFFNADGYFAHVRASRNSLGNVKDGAVRGTSYEEKESSYDNGGQKMWCVGKPAAEDMYLQRNIDFACGAEGGVDCGFIQEGGPCFWPDTPIAHASFAMNLYYQKNGRNWWNCHFNNTGLVVFTDPSFGACTYTPQWRI